MKAFASLVDILSHTTKTNEKIEALVTYFSWAPEQDAIWVLALFSGRRPRRIVTSTQLKEWCTELIQLPYWLFEESYHTVGDLAETIALLLPEAVAQEHENSLHYWLERLNLLSQSNEADKKSFILNTWKLLDKNERFVFNKLITGGFRIGISQKTIVNALAKTYHLDAAKIAHMISGNWDPHHITMKELLNEELTNTDISKPYPFFLAYQLDSDLAELGHVEDWQAEWKWDGIRGQCIKRNNSLFVWSRGEELITEKFPEFDELLFKLQEDVVLDGEILPFQNNKPLPFQILQTRIGRKNITRKILQDAPVIFVTYDILELNGEDIRNKPLSARRKLLEQVVKNANSHVLQISPVIHFSDWDILTATRSQARENGSEGLMLKKLSAVYQVGRRRGDWWKWKIDPLTIDAVMIYAQKGHGRRSNLYTDYTFAVKNEDKLVPFTKAYSGLTDKELQEVDAFVKRNALEKFGPVRTVKPELVFEIAFEGIAASNRHKSGVALRFPRILRWRKDKRPDDINTLEDLQQMLKAYGK
jgi:ATP-dependent DNA ligase